MAIPGDTRTSLKNYEWLKEQMTNDEAKKRLGDRQGSRWRSGSELGTNLPRLALAWCLRNPHM